MSFPFHPLVYIKADRYLKLLAELKERAEDIQRDPTIEYRIIAKYLTGINYEQEGER